MHRFFESIIHPLFLAASPRVIVEIGAGEGEHTQRLLRYCATHDATLHVIDPVIQFDWESMREEGAGRIVFHQGRSLDVLPNLPPADAVLIDGDHNWHTAFGELTLLGAAAERSGCFPLVLLHDTAWPYGRRDAYHDPSAIPEESRQSFARGGLRPGRETVKANHGINRDMHHAVKEGGERNGILAALDDFLGTTAQKLTRIDVPGLHGLTILVPPWLIVRPGVAALLEELRCSGPVAAHLRALEESRVRSWSERLRSEAAVIEYERALEAQRSALGNEYAVLRGEYDVLANERDMILRQLQAKQHTIDALSPTHAETLATQQQRLAHILSTRSWRWTHWLRLLDAFRARLRGAGCLRRSHPVRRIGKPAILRTPLSSWNLQSGEYLLSIVIPAFGHWEVTGRCLASVHAHTAHLPYEIIVVDDASPEAPPSLTEDHTNVTMLRNDRNEGFVHSCNRGAASAHGRFLIFLNNDTIVTEGWADALIEAHRLERNVGLVGAKLIEPDGRLQEAGGIVFADGSACNYGRYDDPDLPVYNVLREVDYCSGACILIARALFTKLHGFHLSFAPAYYEDTDLAFRVREHGLRVLYQPFARVIHAEGTTAGRDTSQGIKRFQEDHRAIFERTWRSILSRHPKPGCDLRSAAYRFTPRRILVVDAQIPRPDEDSGSFRMFRILLLLRDLDYDVTFMADVVQHQPERSALLEQRGIHALEGAATGALDRHLARDGDQYDAIILSRVTVAEKHCRIVRRHAPGALLIFDTVDIHFLREERTARILGQPAALRRAEKLRERELNIVREADCTWAVSAPERALLERACPGARVVEVSNIHDIEGAHRGFGERSHLLFLGNFNHRPNADAVTRFVSETLPLIRRSIPGVRLLVVGSHAPASVWQLQNDHVTVTGFVPDLRPFFEYTRVMIAPLRFGAGVKGKIHMSLSHGVPVVTTSVGAEGMHLTHGTDVLIADTAQDTADAVTVLWRDPALWERLSRNGMENIRTFFSPDAALRGIRETLGLKNTLLEEQHPVAERLKIVQAVAHEHR